MGEQLMGDVEIYIGTLASYDGTGYVDANALAGYIKQARDTWSSFGGVMLWEASLALGLYT
jgi:chitinase